MAVVARVMQRWPAGQSTQAVWPLIDWYFPAMHAVQMAAPLVAVIVPASHAVADELPATHAEPAGQVTQSLDCAAPPVLRKLPALHMMGAVAPDGHQWPAMQVLHAVAPSPSWYVPPGQLLHCVSSPAMSSSGSLNRPGAHDWH